ncbi:MAG: leucine-rich repeat domain-containing protein, partial [Planctomycetia bacterium]|nr:leucine-rich repeat domain-containing protein [Planctomycetia bacterium]
KVATIVISDDGIGTNAISLSGADADAFVVNGMSLFLRAGTVLDSLTKDTYAVTVSVADPSLPDSTPVTTNLSLSIRPLSDFLTVETNDTGLTITGYNGPGGVLQIPAAIDGTPVTAIGYAAFFSNRTIERIILPASVTSIGNQAFEDMTKLDAIDVDAASPRFSSIDGVLFDKAQATLLRFPGNRASYTVPDGVTGIADGAFRYTYGLQTIVVSEGVVSIGVQAFGDCHELTSVTLPDSLTSIGFWAFANCWSLTAMTIPANVSMIGTQDEFISAFPGCMKLTTLVVAPGNTSFVAVDGVLYDASLTTLMQVPGGKAGPLTLPSTVNGITHGAFDGCLWLTAITVEEGNTSYAGVDGVLFNAAATELVRYPAARAGSYTVPAGVIRISQNAFEGASQLDAIVLPDGLVEIEGFVFGGCWSLRSVTIPASVSKIGDNAFSGCGVTAFYFLGDPTATTALFPSFETSRLATVYYPRGNGNWSSEFAGLPAVPFDPDAGST